MIRAIDEYKISGVQTTLPFCKFVMQHPAFVSGEFDTNFVTTYFKPEMLAVETSESVSMLAAIITTKIQLKDEVKPGMVNADNKQGGSQWRLLRKQNL